MSRAILIVGTDTEIGKTFVTGRLCRAWRQAGIDCGVYKPVQSGSPAIDHPDSDASRLQAVSGVPELPTQLCAYSFPEPLAPPVAARRTGVELSLNDLVTACREPLGRHELTLIETAGGFLSPTAVDGTVADFAVALGCPILLVARAGLGTVNHTLLTLEAMRRRDLNCLGVMLNGATGTLAELDNPTLIETFGNVGILGVVPHGPGADAALDRIAQCAIQTVQ